MVLRLLLETGADPNRGCPLCIVPESGVTAAAAVLLGHGVGPHVKGDQNATFLHLAAQEGHAGIVAVLLETGADPEVACFGRTPLQAAEAARHNEAAEAIRSRGLGAGYDLCGRGGVAR